MRMILTFGQPEEVSSGPERSDLNDAHLREIQGDAAQRIDSAVERIREACQRGLILESVSDPDFVRQVVERAIFVESLATAMQKKVDEDVCFLLLAAEAQRAAAQNDREESEESDEPDHMKDFARFVSLFGGPI